VPEPLAGLFAALFDNGYGDDVVEHITPEDRHFLPVYWTRRVRSGTEIILSKDNQHRAMSRLWRMEMGIEWRGIRVIIESPSDSLGGSSAWDLL
jgi:hypothetical protein